MKRALVAALVLALLLLGAVLASAATLTVNAGTLQTFHFEVDLDCDGEFAGASFCDGPSAEGDG